MYKIISAGMMKEVRNRAPFHSHLNSFEIVYYTEGSGKLKVGDKTFNFRAGDIVYIPPGIEHKETSKTGFMTIYCITKITGGVGADILFLHDNYSQEFKQVLMQVINNFRIRGRDWEQIVSALVTVLLTYLKAWKSYDEVANYVDVCERIIIANIMDPKFSISGLLDTVPFSKTHLERSFKKETGYTPKAYLIEQRMNYAVNLLKINPLSLTYRIKDISGMCGYCDQYHFSKAFKQKYGLSPSQWRKQHSNDDPID